LNDRCNFLSAGERREGVEISFPAVEKAALVSDFCHSKFNQLMPLLILV
jgi:hypothetical protein